MRRKEEEAMPARAYAEAEARTRVEAEERAPVEAIIAARELIKDEALVRFLIKREQEQLRRQAQL